MEPGDFGRDLRRGAVVLGEIVDKDGAAWVVLLKDGLEFWPLWALVGEYAQGKAMVGQLAGADFLAVIEQIGEHDDISVFGQALHRGDSPGDGPLAVHFAVEKFVEKGPDASGGDLIAGADDGHRIGEIAAGHVEGHAMLLGQPIAEGRDHVQQHLVAIADDEGAAHADHSGPASAWAAAASACGSTPSASAAAIRSGS